MPSHRIKFSLVDQASKPGEHKRGKLPLLLSGLLSCLLVATQGVLPVLAHSVSSPITPVHAINTPVTGGGAPPPSKVSLPFGTSHMTVSSSIFQTRGVNSQPGTVSVLSVPTGPTPAQQQIIAVINGDWAAWTGGPNNNLTVAEVAHLLANPKVTGSQAAVLGMLAQQMFADGEGTPKLSTTYNFAQAKGYVLGTSTSSNALFSNEYAVALPYYADTVAQIAYSTNPNKTFNLYGYSTTNTGPLMTIQQNELGDCFFLSSVLSVVNQNPSLITNMITQNTNGQFHLAFPNGQSVNVQLTDGEIATFSQNRNLNPGSGILYGTFNGAWLPVLGMAENTILGSTGRSAAPASLRAVPLGNISAGGYPSQVLNMLTGQSYGDFGFGDLTTYGNSYIGSILQQDLANGTPISVCSQDHSLAILSYNPATQMATLLNPWGVSGPYNSSADPGLKPGASYTMNNGTIQASLTSMLTDFFNLVVPTSLVGANNPGYYPGTPSSMPQRSSITGNTTNIAVPGVAVTPTTALMPPISWPENRQASLILPVTLSNPGLTAPNFDVTSQQANFDITSAEQTTQQLRMKPVSYVTAKTTLGALPALEAPEGTMVVVNDEPTQIHTARGTVRAAAGAVALVVKIGDEVAVSNLYGKRHDDVGVSIDGKQVLIPVGQTLVLGDDSLDRLRLGSLFADRQAGLVGRFAQTNAFMGSASYAWAFKSCPQFRELLHSPDPGKRKIAAQLMKTGAALMTLAQGRQQ